jgi:hypothetical protein
MAFPGYGTQQPLVSYSAAPMAQYASSAYQAAPAYSTVQVVQPQTAQYMMQPVQRTIMVQTLVPAPSPPPAPKPAPQPIRMPGGFIPKDVSIFFCPPKTPDPGPYLAPACLFSSRGLHT